MGKRKRGADQTDGNNDPPSSDNAPCSSGTEALSEEKPSLLVDSSDLKPLSSGMDVTDNSVKLLNAHHHYNVGRSVFLKRSRHYYSHHYSRRNSGNHGNASSSHGKGPPSREERLSFKLACRNTEPGNHAGTREKPLSRSERIRFSSLVTDSASPDTVKIVCGICQKLLKRKAYILGMGNTVPSGEQYVVAVLVCGHVYHADCLEQRTSIEDLRDPSCPLCLGSLVQAESSGAQE